MYAIVCVYHAMFVHSSADGHLGYSHLLAIMNRNSAAINVRLCKYLSSILRMYLGVDRLGHMYGDCFNFFEQL